MTITHAQAPSMPLTKRLKHSLALAPLAALVLGAGLSASPAQAAQNCQQLTGCAWKICQTQNNIAHAQTHNPKAVRGYQKELGNLNSYCSNDKMRESLLDDIEKSREKIADLRREHGKEMADGKSHKGKKLDKEIAEEQQRIKAFEKDLKHFD